MAMNTNRIIELCLVFLVSILSFSIGTYVGKKYSDNQHKLALLDPNYKHESVATETTSHTTAADAHVTENHANESTTATAKTEANDDHGNPIKANITDSTPITDADVAKMAEEFSEENTEDLVDTSKADSGSIVKTINEDGSMAEDPKPKKDVTKPSVKKAAKVSGETMVREVANISERAKSITQDIKNTDESATDVKSQYTVQVGAFPSPAEAEKIASSLQARGYKATHSVATINGKTWYRVQVGLFSSLQDAQIYKKELVEQNRLTSAIIQRLNK